MPPPMRTCSEVAGAERQQRRRRSAITQNSGLRDLLAQLEAEDLAEHGRLRSGRARGGGCVSHGRSRRPRGPAATGLEAVLGVRVGEHVDDRPPADQARGQHGHAAAVVVQLGLVDGLSPDPAPQLRASPRPARRRAAPGPRQMIAMRGHRSVTSSTMWVDRITTTFSPISASRLRKRLRSSGSRPGGRLVDDDQLRIADQRLGDAEALAHAAGETCRACACARPTG